MSDGTVIIGEAESANPNPDTYAQAVETKAREKNWRPLEEWKGNPVDWVDAKEFLGRQSLFDKIAAQKSQIDSLRVSQAREMADIKTAFAEMSKVQYNKAVADLKSQRREAVQEGNLEAVEKFDEQISEVQTQQAKTEAQVKKGPDAEAQIVQEKFVEWRAKNTWYDSDPELKDEADAIGIGYGAKHPKATPEAVFEYVEKTVQKLYPEKFGKGTKMTERTNSAANVEAGGITHSGGVTRAKADKLSVSDLTPDQQRIMRTTVKSGIMSEAQYLAQMQDALGGQHKTFKEYQPKKEGK